LKEVAVQAGHKVLIEVDLNSVLIVGNPQGIFGQQLRPRQIQVLNVFINIVLTYQIIYS
jgi:hypothetical protein